MKSFEFFCKVDWFFPVLVLFCLSILLLCIIILVLQTIVLNNGFFILYSIMEYEWKKTLKPIKFEDGEISYYDKIMEIERKNLQKW